MSAPAPSDKPKVDDGPTEVSFVEFLRELRDALGPNAVIIDVEGAGDEKDEADAHVDVLQDAVDDLSDDVADLDASVERLRVALQASLEAQRTLVNIVESQAADLKRLAQIVGLLLDRDA